ncbi:heat-inducible transcriptional repressor HrcA [Candidatus Omnitrophota bacterium]
MNHCNTDKKEERKDNVLWHIVHEYVSTVTPVSSKTVAKRMGGKISSATIRNIMGELEHEGYIEQPHTSAGRIPTQFGYRHHVDIVKDQIQLEKKSAERLAAEYTLRISSIKDVIEKTSFLISRELHNAGIVLWPSIGDFWLKQMELVKVNAETVMAVLVTMTNDVKNYIIKLDRELEKSELKRTANYINDNYEQSAVSFIYEDLGRILNATSGGAREEVLEAAGTALKIVDAIIDENIENEIYWEGLNYFMDEPEFQDLNATRQILRFFSDRKDLVSLMRRELPYQGMRIYIGEENSCEMLKDCSVITCGYTLRSKTVGRIGVIGPTRMDYDNALRTVSCLADLISTKLEEING